jgi:hypothetical protein
MATFEVDMGDFRAFFQRMEQAAKGDFRKEFETFLEGLGEEFLRIVQDEFISRHRNKGDGQSISALWQSFQRDGDSNVWRYADDNMTLEVGTELDYAAYANYGHRTLDPAKGKYFTLPNGEMARFVPGYWNGDRFVYDRAADGGMVLKYHWVEGIHFWEAALHAMERLCPSILEAKLQAWMNDYFG